MSQLSKELEAEKSNKSKNYTRDSRKRYYSSEDLPSDFGMASTFNMADLHSYYPADDALISTSAEIAESSPVGEK
ncbi:hypothetical protein MA16_Dca023925 [Dendrobium catenatum]|uniref:Uncharacterized protein n=1 Tax=Dendrobium catenatum TaxID=906689 RepID=A0A2I0VXV5_9ASPA|nr:hypothetical protein MA16_Dca023925 [Dendrobium catenatum]